MKFWGIGVIALTGAASAASAQTPEEIERYKKMTTFTLGGAVAVNDEPYRGLNRGEPRVLAIPFYVYNKGNLTLAGPQISYRFWRPLGVQLSAEGRYRFQNYEADDSPFLEGMDGRNDTFEVGLRAGKRLGRLRLRADGMVDAAGQHDGYQLRAFANVEVANGRMISLRPIAGVSYQSQNFVNYYYGVRASEVRSNVPTGKEGRFMDRPAYFADAAVVPFAGAQTRIRLSRRVQLNGQITTQLLPEEVTNSPIVDTDIRTSAFFGISYAFAGPGVNASPRER